MKQLLKKLTAAILALTCLPVTGLTVSAESEALSYWGNTTWDAFENGEFYDDHGMFTKPGEFLYLGSRGMYVVTPLEDYMRFDLREPVDEAEARRIGQEIARVLDPYYPGLLMSFGGGVDVSGSIGTFIPNSPEESDFVYLEGLWNRSDGLFTGFRLHSYRTESNTPEMEAAVLLELARRHLISGFYGWGETANYENLYFGATPLTEYTVCVPLLEPDDVQAYLDETHPGYVFEEMGDRGSAIVTASDGTTQSVENKIYQVIPTEELDLKGKLDLMVELYDRFGLIMPMVTLHEVPETALGHNALERAGDVTLDCEVDIMDVIALNKQLLGAATLCDTAAKNADVNASGTPDDTDSLSILKYVVELTDTLG